MEAAAPIRKASLVETRPQGFGEAGFSLVEMLVVVAMLSIFMAATYAVMLPLRRSYTTQDVAAGAQQTARMAVEFMAGEIRLAGLNPIESNEPFGFERASATDIQFTSDRIDRAAGETEANGTIDNANFERIGYFFEAGDNSLRERRYEGSPSQITQTLVNNVRELRFRYFDADDNETANLEDIRAVQISLTVEEPAGRDGLLQRNYATKVICRNLFRVNE
jgi:type IV pilus assembly protein PilW